MKSMSHAACLLAFGPSERGLGQMEMPRSSNPSLPQAHQVLACKLLIKFEFDLHALSPARATHPSGAVPLVVLVVDGLPGHRAPTTEWPKSIQRDWWFACGEGEQHCKQAARRRSAVQLAVASHPPLMHGSTHQRDLVRRVRPPVRGNCILKSWWSVHA